MVNLRQSPLPDTMSANHDPAVSRREFLGLTAASLLMAGSISVAAKPETKNGITDAQLRVIVGHPKALDLDGNEAPRIYRQMAVPQNSPYLRVSLRVLESDRSVLALNSANSSTIK